MKKILLCRLLRSIDVNHSAAHLTGVAPGDGTGVKSVPENNNTHYSDKEKVLWNLAQE